MRNVSFVLRCGDRQAVKSCQRLHVSDCRGAVAHCTDYARSWNSLLLTLKSNRHDICAPFVACVMGAEILADTVGRHLA